MHFVWIFLLLDLLQEISVQICWLISVQYLKGIRHLLPVKFRLYGSERVGGVQIFQRRRAGPFQRARAQPTRPRPRGRLSTRA